MRWWDGDMRSQQQRTLLQWSLASAQGRKEREAKPRPRWMASTDWPTPAEQRSMSGQRSRELAERVAEGITGRHDDDHDHRSPFGRAKLGLFRDVYKGKRR